MAHLPLSSTPELFDSFLASPPKRETLRRLAGLLDWPALERLVLPAYKLGGRGAAPYAPVLLIKLMLLEMLYQLSDVQVVAEAADRLSFREFLQLRAGDAIPDDSSLVRFRDRLRRHGLLETIGSEVTRQLEGHGLKLREGEIKIVDATLIEAAVRPPASGAVQDRGGLAAQRNQGFSAPAPRARLDADAAFTVKGKRPSYGYKLHLAQVQGSGLISDWRLSPANVHDSNVFEALLSGREQEVLADKAYDSARRRRWLKRRGIADGIQRKGYRNSPLAARHARRNVVLGRRRGRIEAVFATLKRFMRLGRARYRGLRKVAEQVAWTVLIFNLRRACALLPA
jgi:transposase, IS5 family